MKVKITLNELRVSERPGLKSSARLSGGPRFIVIHHAMCPSSECTYNTLKERDLSTHYEVEKDGSVIEYIDPSEVAWHAGSGFNGLSIGIDLTGKGEESTGPQKQAITDLVTSLCQRYSIPQVVAPDGYKYKNAEEIIENGIGIVRHRNVKATACPGGFPMEILGTISDTPIEIEFTASDENEKEDLASDIATGDTGKKHKEEIKTSGGRFLSKFKYFQEEHPNFSFDNFYSEIENYIEGGIETALPKYGKDYVFGPEHMSAWNMLERSKSQSLAEGTKSTKNIFANWKEVLKEELASGSSLGGLAGMGSTRNNLGTSVSQYPIDKDQPAKKDSDITVKACLHRNSMVLLLKNEKGWDLPGGHLKEGEPTVDGLKREVYEETGLNIEDIEMVNSPIGRRRFFSATFLTDDVHLSNEHFEYKFFHVDKIQNLKDLDETYRAIILKCMGREPVKISRIKIGVKI
tara:strand:+ start:2261 stop:3646 length:1386 start_codon:yes stop_codon:yes gene_type:complete